MTDFGLDGTLRCAWPADGHHPSGSYRGHLERWAECGRESDGTQVSNLMAVTLHRLYVCPEHRQLALDSGGWQEHPAELCRRCGTRPGRERFYVPGEPGTIGFSLAGAQTKVSTRRTVGCEPCWQGFLEQRGVPARSCCGLRHEGATCPDGLVMCCGCFERVPRSQLHALPDGTVEDVCDVCAALERTTARVRTGPPEWVVWLGLWLLGCALVVLGGGWQGFLAGVGLLVSGAGMGLLVRYLIE